MKVVEFLKSLVMPTKMARYRNMSALIGLPFGNALADSAMNYKENYNFLALQEIDEYADEDNKAILKDITDLGCVVNDKGILECETLTDKVNREFKIVYEKDGIKKHINIFFDFYDEEKEEEPAYNLKEQFSNENYEYVENEEQYFLVFTRKFIYYQAHQLEMGNKDEGMEITHNDEKLQLVGLNLDYAGFIPELNLKLEDPNTFGDYIMDKMLVGFSAYARSTAFFQTLIITIVFPLLMVLLFWLFFKRNGRLKRFKEYFNIAAISSILPLLLAFAIAWYLPIVLNWYIFIFSIFYLFALFKINNAQTEY
jgi:hypothetical protein